MAKGSTFLSSIDHETLPDIDGPGPGKPRGLHSESRRGKKSQSVGKDTQIDPSYDKPDPHDLAVDSAHAAHRQVLSDWVRGEASDAKMRKSHRRLHAAIKAHKR